MLKIVYSLLVWLVCIVLPDKVQTMLGELVALEDPSTRTGNLSTCNTLAEWQRLLVAGKLHMTTSKYNAGNVPAGSSFNPPVIAIPAEK